MARSNTGALLAYGFFGAAALFFFAKKAGAAPRPAGAPGGGAVLPTTPVPIPPPIMSPVTPYEIPAAMAPAVGPVTAAAAIWQNFTPIDGPSSGYVNFPSGTQAAALFLPWATDGAGNNYTMWSGQIYIVNTDTPDLAGNYYSRLLGS
jgi:hypothetical protein